MHCGHRRGLLNLNPNSFAVHPSDFLPWTPDRLNGRKFKLNTNVHRNVGHSSSLLPLSFPSLFSSPFGKIPFKFSDSNSTNKGFREKNGIGAVAASTPFSSFSLPSPPPPSSSSSSFSHRYCYSSCASPSLIPNATETPPKSTYIHIPFCRKRCHYCDFPILPVGNLVNGARVQDKMQHYVHLLCGEIQALHSSLSAYYKDNSLCSPLQTVYIGGGTPSLMSPSSLEKILKTLRSTFGVAQGSEISMEMDPGTFDETKLKDFLGLGINRLSMGVQAFDDDLLKICGRSHSLHEVYDAIEMVSASGLKNWSLDLISSLPNQNMELWKKSLKEAILAQPAHISVYDLQIEPGTAFHRRYKPGASPLPSDSEAVDMYRQASAQLSEAGYLHYELSNYAKPGFESKHNLVYWQNAAYYGFGMGAASYFLGRRYSRPNSYSGYLKWAEEFSSHGGKFDIWQVNTDEDYLLDTLMLGLRLARGIDLVRFSETFGFDTLKEVLDSLADFITSGHVVLVDAEGVHLDGKSLVQFWKWESDVETMVRKHGVVNFRLKDPDGFLLSNEIISSIFCSF